MYQIVPTIKQKWKTHSHDDILMMYPNMGNATAAPEIFDLMLLTWLKKSEKLLF